MGEHINVMQRSWQHDLFPTEKKGEEDDYGPLFNDEDDYGLAIRLRP